MSKFSTRGFRFAYSLLFTVCLIVSQMTLSTESAAQTAKVAQSGMTWLNMPVGARAAGMGSAHVAVANDAGSFFWNPAGYAFTEGTSVFANRTQWIADINVSSGAVSHNLGNWGVVGLNMTSLDWGTFHGTIRSDHADQGYEDTGTFSVSSLAAGASYGFRISNQFGVGLNVKYLYENLGSTYVGNFDSPERASAKMHLIALDFGTIYYIGYRDLRLGVSIRNFSNEQAYRADEFALPMTFRMGLAMDVLSIFSENENHTLTVASDFIHSRDYTERLDSGLEYGFRNQFFLRGGYKINYDIESFSLGAGVNVDAMGVRTKVDYAYLHMEFFDSVHMLTVNFDF
ncbi:PorV/PorQ family protein [Balneolales bacterium ANBcel1]|nr:PorV/PorQ family protein [Balneolales bacterium ANBcel1]